MGDIEGGIVQGGDVVSFRGRSFRVSTHIVAAAIFSSCEIPPSAPLCLYLSLLVELLSRPPLQMLPLCHFATLPAGRAQASDVFERLKLAQSSADELGDDRPRIELDPTIAGWKAVGKADICHKYHKLYSRRKNFHAEKFQLSMYDNCGEIENFSTSGEILDVST